MKKRRRDRGCAKKPYWSREAAVAGAIAYRQRMGAKSMNVYQCTRSAGTTA